MATKWKNFTRNCWVKAVACLLILVLTGVSVCQSITFTLYASDNPEAAQLMDLMMLLSDELPDSQAVNQLSYAQYHLTELARLGDENYIKDGKAITTEELANALYNKFYDDAAAYETETSEWAATNYPNVDEDTLKNMPSVEDIVKSLSESESFDDNYISTDDLDSFYNWLNNNPGAFSVCQQEIIDEQLDNRNDLLNVINRLTGIGYYVYDKSTDTTLQNIGASDPSDAQHTLRLGNDYSYLCSLNDNRQPQYTGGALDPSEDGYSETSRDDGDILLIGLTSSAVSDMKSTWVDTAWHLRQLALVLLVSGVLMLLSLIVLICGAGRTAADNKLHFIQLDRVWTEVQAVAVLLAGMLLCSVIIFTIDNLNQMLLSVDFQGIAYMIAIGVSVAVMAIWLTILLSQVRRIKAKQWLNGWIIWRLLHKYGGHAGRWLSKCLRGLYRRFRQTPLHRKVILICIIVPLACAFWFPVPFIIAGALYLGEREADRFLQVCDGAHNIRAGKTDTHITLNGGSNELQTLADDLNSISDGLNDAVSTAVKSERLKSELISNVSHDIKTPLTSIITYVDLLKRCDIADPTAQEYINVLDQKAKRLQTLTLDLFDASKATSGAMQVDFAKTDFDALLRQALGERADHLEKAGLDVRVQSHPLTYIRADGRLLWRILDNLLSNCARYALPNSRVYITMESVEEQVILTIKNISAVELNVPADELMQRFTRGDRSRHTEGSGLGLSIAQSLAELMGGACQIEIDGDLFKASVCMPKWEEG